MVTQEIFDKIFKEGNKDVLNEFLEGYAQKIIETTLCKLPEVMVAIQIQNQAIKKSYKEFFDKHPSLVDRKSEVLSLVQSIELEDSSLSLREILEKIPAKLNTASILSKVEPVDRLQSKEVTNGYL